MENLYHSLFKYCLCPFFLHFKICVKPSCFIHLLISHIYFQSLCLSLLYSGILSFPITAVSGSWPVCLVNFRSLVHTLLLCIDTKFFIIFIFYFLLSDPPDIPEVFIGLSLPYFVSECSSSWCYIFSWNILWSEFWFWTFATYDCFLIWFVKDWLFQRRCIYFI